jgi:hypothetical protein
MEHAKQRRTIDIDRGLFLVRYAAAEDEAHPPTVKVSSEPVSDKNISLVLHPDHKDAVLLQPDTCLVVRAMTQGKISVEVVPTQAGGSGAATVRVEKLTQGQLSTQLPQSRRGRDADLDGFRVLGHVASIGDVVVRANEWLAGPAAPSRIEGISIEWPQRPEDLDIQYSVKTGRPQAVSDRMVSLGSFAGTRGKAMPIVGVTVDLSGPASANFQFSVEAIFLGSPTMRFAGKRVVLSGPTGREPLVGLRVGVEEASNGANPRPTRSSSGPVRQSNRVRVFRSHSKQG